MVDYYEGRPIDPEYHEKLHKPAQRLLEKKDMDDEDKLELLYGIETQFTFTGQDRIPINDIEARFMKGKKKNFMVAHNIQSAVDYDTINLRNKRHTEPNRPLGTTKHRRTSNKKHQHHTKIHKRRYNILKPNITILLGI